MTKDEALKLALEALCVAVEPKKGKVYAREFEPIDCFAMHEQAITALREALAQPAQGATDIAALVEGMKVSVDVSTSELDAGHRLFGTVTLAQENQGSKHGLILLVQEPEANFKRPLPAQPVQEPPPEWAGIKAILDEYGLQAIDFVADWKEALAQPPLPVQPNVTRPCRSCDGTGDRDTGIPESPIATCKPCKGTGQIAIAAQPPQPEQDGKCKYCTAGCPACDARKLPAQEPHNFCPRCGKRAQGVLGQPQIHTCTPPLWGYT